MIFFYGAGCGLVIGFWLGMLTFAVCIARLTGANND